MSYFIMAHISESYPLSVNTPIEEYTHRDSGSVVDLVSTFHVGSPSYFARLADHLEKRVKEGFVVFDEGIREPSPEEISQAGITTKLKYKLRLAGVEYAGRAIAGVEDSSHFTNQSDLMGDPGGDAECPRIVNVDVTELDIARASSIYGLAQSVRSSRSLFRRLETARKGGSLAYNEAIYKELADQFRNSEEKQKSVPKSADRVVVDKRSEVVLGHIDRMREQDEAAKAAVVWGYGHRRGLADGLEARGFRCTRTTSIMVAFSPSPFL